MLSEANRLQIQHVSNRRLGPSISTHRAADEPIIVRIDVVGIEIGVTKESRLDSFCVLVSILESD